MNEQYGGGQGDEPPRDDRPGPYRGVFGSPGQSPGSPPPPPHGPSGQNPAAPGGKPGQDPTRYGGDAGQDPTAPGGQPGQDPARYSGQGASPYGEEGRGYSQQGNPWGYRAGTEAVPKQVTVAAAISLGLGALCVLGGLFSLTSAAAPMAEMLMGSKDATGWLVVVFLLCGVAYILPAVFLRKRRNWARNLLMVVATFGIAGGVTALPGSILGLAIHVTLLALMLQGPTKTWFLGVRR
ncbi:hypothetical protein EV648_10128 [Kribbella sp. VKM Ac-2568]|nr:hypothetical protein EV648_10128 [Kribbella sp. VKM Ac-2568]